VTADNAASVAWLVVVIDSHRLVLEATAGLLGSWGYDVIEASSYLGAIEAIARHGGRPDLIVCDYELSRDESGIEVVQRLRAALGFDIPAVLIGAEVDPRSLQVGGGRYRLLETPVAAETLRMALLDILGPGPPPGGD
jgi:two-component system, sensor histidine kinase